MSKRSDSQKATTSAPESECGRRFDTANTAGGIGAEVNVVIDGRKGTIPSGATILEAARVLGIHIPSLCVHEDLCTAGVCRVCVVEVQNQRTLQAACSYPITNPLSVRTHTPAVRRARRNILELLIARHEGNCVTCIRNGTCELQKLAHEYGVDRARFETCAGPDTPIDHSSPAIVRDPGKCVLCRRCVRTCSDLQGVGALAIAGRGAPSRVTPFRDRPLGEVVCISCGQCINRCPTGALHEVDATADVWAAIDDPKQFVVIQTAPAPRAAIAEEFGAQPGRALTFQLNSAFRQCGFDRVFDTNFTADLTIIEEGTELILRLKRALHDKLPVTLPMFTSCSPGWVKYLEHFYPDSLTHLSTCKSPQQMFGSILKTYFAEQNKIDPANIVSVALMPCTAKKMECDRPEMIDSGRKDIDYVLTTREAARMIKQAGIDLFDTPTSDFDAPFGSATGSGVIFGATGGVMEAALRTVIELATGKRVETLFAGAEIEPVRGFDGVRVVSLPLPEVGPVPEILSGFFKDWNWLKGTVLKAAICHGSANARRVLENLHNGGEFSDYHFIEFMACPGGCLGGGGQPIPTSPRIRAARAEAIYREDRAYEIRKSHENPAVLALYQKFLTDGPGGHRSHQLLHTEYTARGKRLA